MIEKLRTSFQLVMTALRYIARDKILLIYSLLSLLATIAILITFVATEILFFGFMGEETADALLYAYLFFYYFVFSFITFFFNTAIITSVQKRIEGKEVSFGDGLKESIKHLKAILIWSLINSTVNLILKIIQDRVGKNSVMWNIITGLVWWAWNILTFFAFPLMILQEKSPKDAIKESGILFKKTWWERAILHVGTGFIFGFLIFLVFILGMFLMFSSWAIWISIGFIIFWIVCLMLISSTCDVIIKTLLLEYSKTWLVPSWVQDERVFQKIGREL